MTTPVPYTRGTKTVRIKTARLKPGDQVLTIGTVPPFMHLVTDAQTKTDSLIRTVQDVQATMLDRPGRRAQRVYRVNFTDGTAAINKAPSRTWHGIEPATGD